MKALAIFGSTARNERSFDSDIDMIGIYDEKKISSVSKGNVSLFLYPETILREKMTSGDLFALHLVKESIPIYGHEQLESIYKDFKYKKNYAMEINTAIKVSDEIISRYKSLSDYKEANKKMAWCLRTVIISISAQDKTPVFSKKSLSEYVKIEDIEPRIILALINVKSIRGKLPKRVIDFFSITFSNLSRKYVFDHDNYDEALFHKILKGIETNTSEKEY